MNKGEEIENHYLTEIKPSAINEYWENLSNSIKPKPAIIYLRNKKHEDLHKFSISNFESYDNTSLRKRKVYNLKGVAEIIIVESTYSACCSSHYISYFLYSNTEKLIQLPEIENNHCDGPEPYFDYVFPNETGGKKDKIIYAKITPNEKYENDKIEVLKTYLWNGKKLSSK